MADAESPRYLRTGSRSPRFAVDDGAAPVTLVERQRLDAALEVLTSSQRAWAKATGFKAKLGEICALPGEDGALARILFGWGDAKARKGGRFALARLAASAPEGVYRLETRLPNEDAGEQALGWLLAQYRFDKYKSKRASKAWLVAPEGIEAARIETIAQGVYMVRDLVNIPAGDLGPEALHDAMIELAERHGAGLRAVVGDDLLEQNYPMIHAVGRAGPQAPRLLDMVWGNEAAPKVTLVGKGVCFDTGGLDLKTAAGMALMKKDMGGAANILALAHMVMARKLPVRLRVLIPAVENSVSASAFRPGDVLTARDGTTVEIGNTDAEGRLVLADALVEGASESPELMFDFATLTGAARVALGPDVPPVFTDDDELAKEIADAADAARDPLWRLPLWDAYDADIDGRIADLNNAPGGGFAGAITAALFLRRFAKTRSWAHVDLFAWTPRAKPGRPVGGECQAARAIFALLENRYGDKE